MEKLYQIEKIYWRIAKIIGVLIVILGYKLWTEPFSFIKAVLLLILNAVDIFVIINLLDIFVGLVVRLFQFIRRRYAERRLLRDFCNGNATGDNSNAVE